MRVKVGFVFLAALCQSVHADKASFQVGISQALESLEQASLDRDSAEAGMSAGRKLFVQHLLKEVSSEESTRADVPALLLLIRDILLNISGFIQAERNTDHTWYLSKKNKYDSCPNNTAQQEDGQMETSKNTALQNHHSCRINEEKPFGDLANTACSKVQSAIHTWIFSNPSGGTVDGFTFDGKGSSMAMNCDDWPGSLNHQGNAGVIDPALANCLNVLNTNCVHGAYSQTAFAALFHYSDEVGGSDVWWLGGNSGSHGPWHHVEQFLLARRDLFSSGGRGSTPGDATDCVTNYNNWVNVNGYQNPGTTTYDVNNVQSATCTARQRIYEAGYCSFQYIRQRRCADLNQCYWREEAVFNTEETNVFNRETVRVRDNAVVMYVACIVERLAADLTEDFALTNSSCAGKLELTQYKTGCVAGVAPAYAIPAGCTHGNVALTLGAPLVCDNSTAVQASPSVLAWETQEFLGGVDHDSNAGTPKQNHAGVDSVANPILDVSSYDGWLVERRNRVANGFGDYHC